MRRAIALLILLTWRSALAGCVAPPAVEFAPESGAVLTAQPTIYVFFRRSDKSVPEIGARVDGVPISATSELLVNEPDRIVVAAHIGAPKATRLAITFAGASASYRISALKPAPAEETRVTRAEFVFTSGCPNDDAFLLTVRPAAPAYRLEWTDKQGKAKRDVVPPVWTKGRAQLAFGSFGCFGHAVDARPFDVSIEPLFADGREGDVYFPGCSSTRPRLLNSGAISASVASCVSTSVSFRGPVRVAGPPPHAARGGVRPAAPVAERAAAPPAPPGHRRNLPHAFAAPPAPLHGQER